MVNVVFTGLYRYNKNISNLTLEQRIKKIKDNGVNNIYWYVWKGHAKKEVEKLGVKVVEIDEPYTHIKGILGRQRQIYNVQAALQDFDDNDVVLKLRWDLDFNDALMQNICDLDYFDKVESGVIDNKVWTGFYSIQELFSPADKAFAGYKKDLNKLVNFQYIIDGASANNYISHDGMMLMAPLIEKNKEVCNLIKLQEPNPNSLMFTEEQYYDERYLDAWAFSYYLLHKYFKTGPLGSCFFKRGDIARWPMSFVNHNDFKNNYETIIGKAPKLGLYPRYRAYDDVFIEKLINGEFRDHFAQSLHSIIAEKKKVWQEIGV